MNYGFKCEGINQIMSLPRAFTVNEDYSINEAPIPQLECMRGEHISGETIAKANEDTVLNVGGDSLEIRVKISAAERKIEHNFIPDNLIPAVEVRVLRSPDTREYTAIRFYRNRSVMDWKAYQNHSMHWANGSESVVEIDSSSSSLSPDVSHHPAEHQSFFLNCDEDIDLRIFVDKSIVEVFANGKRCVAARAYPTLPDAKTVSVLSRGIDVNVKYDAWKMKKIEY